MTEAVTLPDEPAESPLASFVATEPVTQTVPWVNIFRHAAVQENFTFKDGPLVGEIDEVLSETNRRLMGLSPELRPEHLQPDSYVSEKVQAEKRTILGTKGLWAYRAAFDISEDHRTALARVGIRHALHSPRELIAPGTLEFPQFHGDSHSSKCALFCFQMIANALLPPELEVETKTLTKVVTRTDTDKRLEGDHRVDYDLYAHALTSDLFAEASRCQTEYIQLRGATIEIIGKIASGIKKRRPDARVFCTLPLQSDNFKEFWHQVILTAAIDKGVLIHNPGGDHARPNQLIDPIKFYKKWSTCMNIAHIFISAPH